MAMNVAVDVAMDKDAIGSSVAGATPKDRGGEGQKSPADTSVPADTHQKPILKKEEATTCR